MLHLCRQYGFLPALWLMLTGGLGCSGAPGDAPPRAVVSGKVTYAGQPVQNGTIRFVPESGSGLPIAAGAITDGQYRVENKGGVAVGSYRVEINATRPDESAGPVPDDVPPPQEQYIPDKYNSQSTLTLTVSEAGASLEQDFLLDE